MKKYLHRILAMIMALVTVFTLTACGGNAAPVLESTAPPTTEAVSACEINGHTWEDATCEAAKTCTVCGETEGEALGHTWIEANYHAPKTCEICGATEGDALVSYFDEWGLTETLCDLSGEYDLTQTCGSDTSLTTVLKVKVTDYKTIASDETHAALDGYEWKIMTYNIHLWDANAQKHGISTYNYMWDSFYIGETPGANGDNTGLFENGMAHPFTWNGTEYPDGLLHISESVSPWEKDENGNLYLDITVTVSVRVPVGYDGFVFGLEGHNWEWPEGKYLHEVITDNTLLYRFD